MPRHTPEERKKRREEVKQRTVLVDIAQLGKAAKRPGIEPQPVTRVRGASGEFGIPQTEAQVQAEQEKVKALKRTEREEEAQAFLEEKGFSPAAPPPQRTELDIEPGFGGGIAVIGPSTSALQSVIADVVRGTKFAGPKIKDIEPLLQDPQSVREIALQEIQRKVIEEGTSAGEKFGALIELIPIVGGAVATYASGLIETPGGNVKIILGEIDSERERASVLAEKVLTGKFGDPRLAFEQIEDIEDNIIKLEQRLKLLANQSATLRANADNLNRIEEKILRAKERVFIAKQAAAGGITGVASDTSLFLELKELEGR